MTTDNIEKGDRILGSLDPAHTRAIAVSERRGGIALANLGEMMDLAKLMAVSDKAVPEYLRNNVGACLAVVMQAEEWGFSSFTVARMSYVVNDQIAYMSQLLHAVIEKRAPLRQRLRAVWEGSGESRKITVIGHIQNEVDPLSYTSPTVGQIKVGRGKDRDGNPKRGSPLWDSDPDQQLWYYGTRAWSRRYCADVLMGVYAREDFDVEPHLGAERALDVTGGASLHERLVKANSAMTDDAPIQVREGFNAESVASALNGEAPADDTAGDNAPKKARAPRRIRDASGQLVERPAVTAARAAETVVAPASVAHAPETSATMADLFPPSALAPIEEAAAAREAGARAARSGFALSAAPPSYRTDPSQASLLKAWQDGWAQAARELGQAR